MMSSHCFKTKVTLNNSANDDNTNISPARSSNSVKSNTINAGQQNCPNVVVKPIIHQSVADFYVTDANEGDDKASHLLMAAQAANIYTNSTQTELAGLPYKEYALNYSESASHGNARINPNLNLSEADVNNSVLFKAKTCLNQNASYNVMSCPSTQSQKTSMPRIIIDPETNMPLYCLPVPQQHTQGTYVAKTEQEILLQQPNNYYARDTDSGSSISNMYNESVQIQASFPSIQEEPSQAGGAAKSTAQSTADAAQQPVKYLSMSPMQSSYTPPPPKPYISWSKAREIKNLLPTQRPALSFTNTVIPVNRSHFLTVPQDSNQQTDLDMSAAPEINGSQPYPKYAQQHSAHVYLNPNFPVEQQIQYAQQQRGNNFQSQGRNVPNIQYNSSPSTGSSGVHFQQGSGEISTSMQYSPSTGSNQYQTQSSGRNQSIQYPPNHTAGNSNIQYNVSPNVTNASIQYPSSGYTTNSNSMQYNQTLPGISENMQQYPSTHSAGNNSHFQQTQAANAAMQYTSTHASAGNNQRYQLTRGATSTNIQYSPSHASENTNMQYASSQSSGSNGTQFQVSQGVQYPPANHTSDGNNIQYVTSQSVGTNNIQYQQSPPHSIQYTSGGNTIQFTPPRSISVQYATPPLRYPPNVQYIPPQNTLVQYITTPSATYASSSSCNSMQNASTPSIQHFTPSMQSFISQRPKNLSSHSSQLEVTNKYLPPILQYDNHRIINLVIPAFSTQDSNNASKPAQKFNYTMDSTHLTPITSDDLMSAEAIDASQSGTPVYYAIETPQSKLSEIDANASEYVMEISNSGESPVFAVEPESVIDPVSSGPVTDTTYFDKAIDETTLYELPQSDFLPHTLDDDVIWNDETLTVLQPQLKPSPLHPLSMQDNNSNRPSSGGSLRSNSVEVQSEQEQAGSPLQRPVTAVPKRCSRLPTYRSSKLIQGPTEDELLENEKNLRLSSDTQSSMSNTKLYEGNKQQQMSPTKSARRLSSSMQISYTSEEPATTPESTRNVSTDLSCDYNAMPMESNWQRQTAAPMMESVGQGTDYMSYNSNQDLSLQAQVPDERSYNTHSGQGEQITEAPRRPTSASTTRSMSTRMRRQSYDCCDSGEEASSTPMTSVRDRSRSPLRTRAAFELDDERASIGTNLSQQRCELYELDDEDADIASGRDSKQKLYDLQSISNVTGSTFQVDNQSLGSSPEIRIAPESTPRVTFDLGDSYTKVIDDAQQVSIASSTINLDEKNGYSPYDIEHEESSIPPKATARAPFGLRQSSSQHHNEKDSISPPYNVSERPSSPQMFQIDSSRSGSRLSSPIVPYRTRTPEKSQQREIAPSPKEKKTPCEPERVRSPYIIEQEEVRFVPSKPARTISATKKPSDEMKEVRFDSLSSVSSCRLRNRSLSPQMYRTTSRHALSVSQPSLETDDGSMTRPTSKSYSDRLETVSERETEPTSSIEPCSQTTTLSRTQSARYLLKAPETKITPSVSPQQMSRNFIMGKIRSHLERTSHPLPSSTEKNKPTYIQERLKSTSGLKKSTDRLKKSKTGNDSQSQLISLYSDLEKSTLSVDLVDNVSDMEIEQGEKVIVQLCRNHSSLHRIMKLKAPKDEVGSMSTTKSEHSNLRPSTRSQPSRPKSAMTTRDSESGSSRRSSYDDREHTRIPSPSKLISGLLHPPSLRSERVKSSVSLVTHDITNSKLQQPSSLTGSRTKSSISRPSSHTRQAHPSTVALHAKMDVTNVDLTRSGLKQPSQSHLRYPSGSLSVRELAAPKITRSKPNNTNKQPSSNDTFEATSSSTVRASPSRIMTNTTSRQPLSASRQTITSRQTTSRQMTSLRPQTSSNFRTQLQRQPSNMRQGVIPTLKENEDRQKTKTGSMKSLLMTDKVESTCVLARESSSGDKAITDAAKPTPTVRRSIAKRSNTMYNTKRLDKSQPPEKLSTCALVKTCHCPSRTRTNELAKSQASISSHNEDDVERARRSVKKTSSASIANVPKKRARPDLNAAPSMHDVETSADRDEEHATDVRSPLLQYEKNIVHLDIEESETTFMDDVIANERKDSRDKFRFNRHTPEYRDYKQSKISEVKERIHSIKQLQQSMMDPEPYKTPLKSSSITSEQRQRIDKGIRSASYVSNNSNISNNKNNEKEVDALPILPRRSKTALPYEEEAAIHSAYQDALPILTRPIKQVNNLGLKETSALREELEKTQPEKIPKWTRGDSDLAKLKDIEGRIEPLIRIDSPVPPRPNVQINLRNLPLAGPIQHCGAQFECPGLSCFLTDPARVKKHIMHRLSTDSAIDEQQREYFRRTHLEEIERSITSIPPEIKYDTKGKHLLGKTESLESVQIYCFAKTCFPVVDRKRPLTHVIYAGRIDNLPTMGARPASLWNTFGEKLIDSEVSTTTQKTSGALGMLDDINESSRMTPVLPGLVRIPPYAPCNRLELPPCRRVDDLGSDDRSKDKKKMCSIQ